MDQETFLEIEGGCICGAVRYCLTSAPLFVHCCHCTWCQTETGSAFAVNILIESDRVRLKGGQTKAILTPSASGKGQRIHRCPVCFVAVWSHYAGAGDAIRFVRAGTLDDPSRCPPDIHIYTMTAQSWLSLPADVPQVAEYYDIKAMWPEESLNRRYSHKA
ncbi:MAG: GFA family protein [Proteobacteria bacterium]|nr:GFA family protein [Pseudomonadota bacterium]